MSEEYNGWTNYETWQANLYLDSGYGFENYSKDCLKDFLYEALKVDNEDGLKRDILNTWFSEVNWYELAEHYKEEDDNEFLEWLEQNYEESGLGQDKDGEDLMFYLSQDPNNYLLYDKNQLREIFENLEVD